MAIGNMIVEYVLDPSHLERLKIAIEIVKIYPQIKRSIIFDFATRLDAKFAEKYPAFKMTNTLKRYEQDTSDVGVVITKPSWNNIGIGFQAQKSELRGFIIGVCKIEKSESSSPELLAELNDRYGEGDSDEWWHYSRRFDNFPDWDDDRFIELRKSSTLDIVVNEMERIRLIAEPIINRALLSPGA